MTGLHYNKKRQIYYINKNIQYDNYNITVVVSRLEPNHTLAHTPPLLLLISLNVPSSYALPPSSPPSPPSGSLPPLLSSPLLPLFLTLSLPPSSSSLLDASGNCRATGCCLLGRLGVLGLVELQLVLGKLGLAELLGLSL